MNLTKTVGEYAFGAGSFSTLGDTLSEHRADTGRRVIFFVDKFFEGHALAQRLPVETDDQVIFVDTTSEPTTDGVDAYTDIIRNYKSEAPAVMVGVGGGSVLDTTKAVANLMTNPGKAADYQGWDLVQNPGIFKIGIPTLSGTGAEGSRTCVMMNQEKNLKLGMNSPHTVYDRLILDPELTASVPRDQYFYTGMDTYIHCIESLNGNFRHGVADAFSEQSLALCREVFLSDDMQSDENREKLMIASYLGGSAIGNSFVGVVHPFSAGLSMVFHTHHCIGNCIVMNVMEEFYPTETEEFHRMIDAQGISLPVDMCKDLSTEQHKNLHDATVIHEKPLINALGEDFRDVLTPEKVASIFAQM